LKNPGGPFCVIDDGSLLIQALELGTVMKFAIDFLPIRDVLEQSKVNVIGPRWAKAQAQRLMNEWKARGANGVRIVYYTGHQVHYWRED
jgi:hypothetical protein